MTKKPFFLLVDLWINGGSISSQLNKEALRNIKEIFTDLQTQVKLKLLLSFFHIPRRLIDEVGNFMIVACFFWKCIINGYIHEKNTYLQKIIRVCHTQHFINIRKRVSYKKTININDLTCM